MWKRAALLAALVGSAVFAWSTGLHEQLRVDNVRALVEGAGLLAPVVFVLLFGLEGLGLPGVIFMLTALALWPPWTAFLLNWLGAITAGIVGFGFARYVGRDWVARKLPARVRRFETRVVERGVQTVVLMRLLFFLAPWAHWALGLSPVSFRAYLVGTALGFVPALLLVSFFGGPALEWIARQPREVWMGLAGAFVVCVIGWRLQAARRRALAPVTD